jgi:hypothetical protein
MHLPLVRNSGASNPSLKRPPGPQSASGLGPSTTQPKMKQNHPVDKDTAHANRMVEGGGNAVYYHIANLAHTTPT